MGSKAAMGTLVLEAIFVSFALKLKPFLWAAASLQRAIGLFCEKILPGSGEIPQKRQNPQTAVRIKKGLSITVTAI